MLYNSLLNYSSINDLGSSAFYCYKQHSMHLSYRNIFVNFFVLESVPQNESELLPFVGTDPCCKMAFQMCGCILTSIAFTLVKMANLGDTVGTCTKLLNFGAVGEWHDMTDKACQAKLG